MDKRIVIAILVPLIVLGAVLSGVAYIHLQREGIIPTNDPDFCDGYHFEAENGTERIVCDDNWTFDISIIKPYELEGKVLGLNYYKRSDIGSKPIDTFSPIDLFIGVDDVAENTENYPYRVTSWDYRYVHWYVDDNYDYFRSHVGNNHIIPHNGAVHKSLFEVNVGDSICLKGHLVNMHGERGDRYYDWESDTEIGDSECEVILVDEFSILS